MITKLKTKSLKGKQREHLYLKNKRKEREKPRKEREKLRKERVSHSREKN